MPERLRSVVARRPRAAAAAAASLIPLAVALAGGCSGAPTGGTATEPEAVRQQREDTIKDAMKRGAYGDQYKDKGGPAK